MKKSVNFEFHTAERLIRNSQLIDQLPRQKVKQSRTPLIYNGLTAIRLTETLPRCSNSFTPTFGTGIPQTFDGTHFTDIGTTAYPIMNTDNFQISNGSLVWCGPGYGRFVFVKTACANAS